MEMMPPPVQIWEETDANKAARAFQERRVEKEAEEASEAAFQVRRATFKEELSSHWEKSSRRKSVGRWGRELKPIS